MSPSLDALVVKLRELQPYLHEEFGVSGLWLFGSYVHGGETNTSDLDVLVEFDRRGMTLFKFIDLEALLTEKLGVKVDLVQRSALRPRLRPRILEEAIAV